MKCVSCGERNGSTRCEGCQTLFCLPCMNKHHDELLEQFQQLMDSRNEVKQMLDTTASTSQNETTVPCMVIIDRWEQEIIQRIRQIAARARTNVHEIMAKSMVEMRRQFEELSVEMQQRQKEGNHLENDINNMRSQLDKLKIEIEHVKEKIDVDTAVSNTVEWDSLIYVIEGVRSPATVPNSSTSFDGQLTQGNYLSIKTTTQLGNSKSKHFDTSNTVPSCRERPSASQQTSSSSACSTQSTGTSTKEGPYAQSSGDIVLGCDVLDTIETWRERSGASQQANSSTNSGIWRIVTFPNEQPYARSPMDIAFDPDEYCERPPWKY